LVKNLSKIEKIVQREEEEEEIVSKREKKRHASFHRGAELGSSIAQLLPAHWSPLKLNFS